jgi:EAL domain-containing protein (putative c-di-GMP-specific phosphodiesterase class I)
MVKEPDVQNREPRLADYADRLGADERDGVAIHLHLGRLGTAHRQPFHKRLCHEYLRPFVERHKGSLYGTVAEDWILVLFGIDEAETETLLAGLRLLYASDPLIGDARPSETGRFSQTYRFDDALDDFKALTKHLMADWQAAQEGEDPAPEPPTPVEARHLPQLLDALKGADVGAMVARESVCVLVGGNPPRPVFDEVTVDYEKLSRQLLANIDLTAHRWYRHAVEDVVVERLLTWFDNERVYEADDTVAIDITIAALMSESFLAFDRKASDTVRKKMIFELREADLLGDLGSGLFLRDYLQSRGYRVALDGTNHLTLPLIGRERLGFDFVKLRWGPDYETALTDIQGKALAAAIERIGQARTILSNCQTARAVDAGQRLGISLFQGAYVETMLRFDSQASAKQKVEA